MDRRAEARLDPFIRAARATMRRRLGFRPETRMDEIVMRDGTVFRELANGTFVGVRRGVSSADEYDDQIRWFL